MKDSWEKIWLWLHFFQYQGKQEGSDWGGNIAGLCAVYIAMSLELIESY